MGRDVPPARPAASSGASSGASSAARRWLVTDAALLLLAVVLVGVLAVLWSRDAEATGGSPEAERVSVLYREVTPIATEAAAAFLEVDYRDMETVTARVLDVATGDFAEQYAADTRELVASVTRARAVVTSSARAVGVSELGPDRALVLVAADSALRDRDDAQAQLRKHRMRLVLEQQDGRWRVSQLEFVR